MVSPSSLLAPAAAALALAAAALVPRAAATLPRAPSSSVLRPGSAPMKGSESKPEGRGAARGVRKGSAGTARRIQKGSKYCHSDRAPKFAVNESPGKGECLEFPTNKATYTYPLDFELYGPVLNEMAHYVCPESGVRVIESNSIPDHAIYQGNMNFPCEKLAYFELPLNPTRAAQRTEVPPLRHIGVATNGVHLFGAMEAFGGNALDEEGSFPNARFWYGHATAGKRSHYHSPNVGHDPLLGEESGLGEDELLGWALDGYGIYGFTDQELDECNGRFVDGEYRYHVRYPDGWDPVNCWDADMPSAYCSEEFPGANNWNYILGCYWGETANTKIGDLAGYQRPDDCVLTPVSGPVPGPPAPKPNPEPTDATCVERRGACSVDLDCCSFWCGGQGKCRERREHNVEIPPVACEDSNNWAYIGNRGPRGCLWVGLNPNARCGVTGRDNQVARSACPAACGEC